MNMVRTNSLRNFTSWRQQGRAVRQWLGAFYSGLDWLEYYASQQNQCLNWIDGSNVRLRETPLFGTCLTDITESLLREQSLAKADVNKHTLSVGDIRNAGSARFKQQDRKTLKRPEPAKSAKSVSMARRVQVQASCMALREWGNTKGPVCEASDQTVPVHSFPADSQREKKSGSNKTFRKISSADEKAWARKPLHRVKNILAEEKEKVNYSVGRTAVPDSIKTKRIKTIKQGSLLPEQWKSVFRDQEISHELLMKIVSNTARISPIDINNSQAGSSNEADGLAAPAFKEKYEHVAAIHQALNSASLGSQRSDDRQHKNTLMTHRETQSGSEFLQSTVFHDTSFVQKELQPKITSTFQLKNATNHAAESLDKRIKNKPAEIERNDKELAVQIKRILDEEARRYGIDV